MRLEEAGELLRTRRETDQSDRELAKLLAALPVRQPMRPVSAGPEPLLTVPARGSAEELVVTSETAAERKAADDALRDALTVLPSEDQVIVRLHYWDGLGVADIARGLGLPQKPLYRRIERALGQLRRHLEAVGISRARARALLEEPSP
jgi:RNA polymerase sigma factor for flagellar operon FliA